MKFFNYAKDGGYESTVSGLYFIEIKSLFTVVLLKFSDGSREAYHNHAFNSVSWLFRGQLSESMLTDGKVNEYKPSIKPIFTGRKTFHKVTSKGTTWVLSFRGPWLNIWNEFLPKDNKFITLTHGRKIV